MLLQEMDGVEVPQPFSIRLAKNGAINHLTTMFRDQVVGSIKKIAVPSRPKRAINTMGGHSVAELVEQHGMITTLPFGYFGDQ
jgi:hypothetical protein